MLILPRTSTMWLNQAQRQAGRLQCSIRLQPAPGRTAVLQLPRRPIIEWLEERTRLSVRPLQYPHPLRLPIIQRQPRPPWRHPAQRSHPLCRITLAVVSSRHITPLSHIRCGTARRLQRQLLLPHRLHHQLPLPHAAQPPLPPLSPRPPGRRTPRLLPLCSARPRA